MNERIDRLVERAALLDEEAPETRRRDELVERALAAGHTREAADQIYDLAEEEGVDPGVALELVLAGVGVRELETPSSDHWDETQVGAPPAWVSEPAIETGDVVRERRIRNTLRRLRSISESAGSTQEAVRTFVRQPDVGAVDY